MSVSLPALSILLLLSCRHAPQDADITSAITSRFIEEQSVNLLRVDVYVEGDHTTSVSRPEVDRHVLWVGFLWAYDS